MSYFAESCVFDSPNRGYLVSLRCSRFMANMPEQMDRYTNQDRSSLIVYPRFLNNIGALAAVIVQEDIYIGTTMQYTS
ncbi:hypothetical protein V8B55DRAFT_1471613 [Mucor lusitanicus]